MTAKEVAGRIALYALLRPRTAPHAVVSERVA